MDRDNDEALRRWGAWVPLSLKYRDGPQRTQQQFCSRLTPVTGLWILVRRLGCPLQIYLRGRGQGRHERHLTMLPLVLRQLLDKADDQFSVTRHGKSDRQFHCVLRRLGNPGQ